MTIEYVGNKDFRNRWIPLYSVSFALLAVIAYVIPGAVTQLGYDRSVPYEIWRALTCHWAHWNFDHFIWSAGTFIVLAVMCEKEDRKQFLICLLLSALMIPAVLWFLMPGLNTYGGLSGIDSALFVLIAITLLREKAKAREWKWVACGSLLLIGFFTKIGFEFLTNETVFAKDVGAMTPVPLAHIVGGAVGAAIGLVFASPNARGNL